MRLMKDNGIEWIGLIPEDWEIEKISRIYNERNEKVSDKDFRALSVTKKGILPQLESVAKTDNGDNRKLVLKGDFVINSRSDRRGSCGISPYDGSVSLINTVLKPCGDISNKYYNYVFKSERFADEFYKWGHGIVDDLWSTKWNDMKHIYIPVPPIEEQEKIAMYLEQKCLEINNIVMKTKETIEEYKKYRKSLITEIVTKGLNKNIDMQESDIEWIGMMPKRWKKIKIKRLVTLYNGKEIPVEVQKSQSSYNVYGSGGVFKYTNDYLYDGEAVLFGRKGSIGKPLYIIDKFWAIDTMYYSVCNRNLNSKLFYYLLSVFPWDKYTTKTALPIVVGSEIFNCVIPISIDIREQEEIVEYLDGKCMEIDKLIDKKEKLIVELENYKKSLIYECVTGKKEIYG